MSKTPMRPVDVKKPIAPKAKLPAIADIEAAIREWLVEDPSWAKQLSDDLWEQIAKSRAGLFDT